MTSFYVTGVDDFVIANVFFNVGNKGDDVFFRLSNMLGTAKYFV